MILTGCQNPLSCQLSRREARPKPCLPLPFGRERDSSLASTIQPLNKVTPRVWQDAAARGFGANEHAQWQRKRSPLSGCEIPIGWWRVDSSITPRRLIKRSGLPNTQAGAVVRSSARQIASNLWCRGRYSIESRCMEMDRSLSLVLGRSSCPQLPAFFQIDIRDRFLPNGIVMRA